MHLRFNHCILLLLRPLILRQVACLFSDEKSNAPQEDLEYINNNCLKSAWLNVLIMINVRSAGLIKVEDLGIAIATESGGVETHEGN
ncbi:hypothetical protein V2G26_004111 [Clonostachys chloroleuca]